jgi:hypothetical protein
MKKCSVCKVEKSKEEFNKLKLSLDGLNYNCKTCDKQKRLKNEERLKNRSSFLFPDEKLCTKCQTIKSKNCFSHVKSRLDGLSSKCKECSKNYSANRRVKLSSRDLNLVEHPDTKHCPDCKLELNNKEFGRSIHNACGLNTYCKKCNKARYGLRNKLSGRIRIALKRHLIKKSTRTIDLIGCSIDFFEKYLESRFIEGMSFEALNSGKIHIDHIIPCSSFDLSDVAQQYKCFHYTNLQPLWAVDNLIKSNKTV